MVVNGRGQPRVDAAVDRLRAAVPAAQVRGIAADVADDQGAAALLAELPDVDILVNNLGIFGARPVLEIDDAEWRRYFEVNVLAGVRLTRSYLPGMIERGFGRVLSISSDLVGGDAGGDGARRRDRDRRARGDQGLRQGRGRHRAT